MINENFIGKDIDEVSKFCKKNHILFRIKSEDGQAFMHTCDFRLNRLNFDIVNKIIVQQTKG